MSRKQWPPIIERAAEIVEEYSTPVTLRQLHYRLVAEADSSGSGYRNTEADYKRLSELTADLRRQGEFPSLHDNTRTVEWTGGFDDWDDALAWLAHRFTLEVLHDQPTLAAIIVEKNTLVAQIQDWFPRHPVAALRGYASESLERQILEHVEDDHRDVVLLYCGDFDPTGEDIPRAFEHNTGLTLQRIALTAEQVDEHNLPPAIGKATDSRAASFTARHGQLVQVELEALDPNNLHTLIDHHINTHTNNDLYQANLNREHHIRTQHLPLPWT